MEKWIRFTSWNRHSRRFVQAPAFAWEPVEGAACYRIGVAAAIQREATWFETQAPAFDLASLWPQLPCGRIDMVTIPLDREGREVDVPSYADNMAFKSFIKSPGWKGGLQVATNWEGAIRHNAEYLLQPARDRAEPFEEGLPRHLWSAIEDSYTGERHHQGLPGNMNSYPALHFPFYIASFLAFADAWPDDPLAPEARRQAQQYGDWLLTHHYPESYACSGFPYSCIAGGKIEEHSPTGLNSLTVFRAAAVGETMLALAGRWGNAEYRRYALGLGEGFLRLQRPDGSWPFRVEPATGRELVEYTSDVVTPARFLDLLQRETGDGRFREARDRAIAWLLENPVRTHRWEGMYEDVAEQKPYTNLQNWDVNEAIRYLVYYREEIPNAVAMAKALNEYIEDQFVVWETGDPAVTSQCPAPLVMEQLLCYEPMECHTGHWIESLLALHSATGDLTYLDKAIAAGNALCRDQMDNGAFCTWPYDLRFGRPFVDQYNWLGCNAIALKALIKLNTYWQAARAGRTLAAELGEFC